MFKNDKDEKPVVPSVHTDTPFVPKEKAFPLVKKVAKQLRVRLANTHLFEDRYLAYNVDDISQVRLVEKGNLKFQVSDQHIDEDIWNASDTPYDFNDEIAAITPTRDQVRLAVYRNGLTKKEDAQNPSLRTMSLYGAYPNHFKSGDNQ